MLATNLTFGVEIECYIPLSVSYESLARTLINANVPAAVVRQGIHTTSTNWKVVADGSLSSDQTHHGVEVVSPILIGEAGLATMAKVAELIRSVGGKVKVDCGFHVHIGARNATVAQLRNLSKMYLRYEAQFDALCPASRQNTRFARSNLACAGGSIAAAFAALDGTRTVEQIARVMNGGHSPVQYNQFRYHKLNFQSMFTHGTVEFRQQAGTVEGEKMIAWVRILTATVAVAFSLRTVAQTEAAAFADLMKKVDRPTAAYLADRRERLARTRA